MTRPDDHDDTKTIPFALTPTDEANLRAGDDAFNPHTWSELKTLIETNNLSHLKRRPSDLHRYIAWTNDTLARYPSMTAFILQERLHWDPLPSSSPLPNGEGGVGGGGGEVRFELANPTPLVDRRDFKIRLNDWPYGVEAGVVHWVVWLRHRLDVVTSSSSTSPASTTTTTTNKEEIGQLTPQAQKLVENFVQTFFVRRVEALEGLAEGQGQERVLWFKNWSSLQSVRRVEHFHVLVRDAPGGFGEELGGE